MPPVVSPVKNANHKVFIKNYCTTYLTKAIKVFYYIPIGGIKMPKGIPRDQSVERSILHRLAIARGHLDKVIQMVESGHYCIDVVHQSMAVQAALREVDHVVLKNHMVTCVADSIRKGESNDVIDEVMKVLEKK